MLILLLGTLLVGVAVLAGSFSPRQPQTVTMDVGFSGIRFSLVLFAVFWVQELVGREVERRTVLYALAYPVSRGAYLLGRFLGVLGLLVVAAVALGGLLWLSVIFSAGEYTQGFPVQTGWPYWLTIAGLWADAAVVAAFTLWIASLSTVQMLPVALGALFAVAGKSLGAVLDYLERGADGDQELIGRYGSLLETIQYLLPDLSRLDWRTWPMYGVPVSDAAVFYGLLMGAGYVLLLLAMAVITFGRREFF
ncbi:ABC transporter permease subunit [Accumulibacter sp.]|uniref:ABC transporter permease n=1 Tax=Accumulibacter sp. TaxID=2053492 RepID=UPI0004BB8A28|nr:ABC transporter permease subunit [Accumulibacter sp.]